MQEKLLNIYLSGEIHTNWRESIKEKCIKINLPISFSSPVTHHENSDDCGVRILGDEYRDKDFTGRDICRQRDIEIFFNKRDHRFSTTDLIKQVEGNK